MGFALSVVGSVTSSPVKAQDGSRNMWGDMKPGSYDVGFKAIFTYDAAKPPVPYSDWTGRLYPTKETRGRQMQLNVWYPAKPGGDETRLRFKHYLELMARQTDFGPMTDEKRRFADDQFVTKTNSLAGARPDIPDGSGSFTLEKLNRLKDLETRAYLDAKPIDKKFPLIVFPNGGSPAFNSIMCEFFASHGYVVLAVALKGNHSAVDEISLEGVESAIYDLGFAINKVLETERVDRSRICLIGNAITSSHIVGYQTRNSNVDCIAFVDGGLLSRFEQSIMVRATFYRPQTVNKPILAIYAPHPSIDPKNIFHLKYSTRYFFRFPGMSEFHFLNYGQFERFVPGIIGKPKGDVQKGFEISAYYALRFFNAHLKDDDESRKFLMTAPTGEAAKHIDRAFTRKAIAAPPNIVIVKDAVIREGISYLERLYRTHKKESAQPFSRTFYNDLKDWLAWKKDPKYDKRFRLYQLALDSFPESATIHYHLAYFAEKTGRKQLAIELNNKTLKLLETDNSPELTNERKAAMRKVIRKDLESLKK